MLWGQCVPEGLAAFCAACPRHCGRRGSETAFDLSSRQRMSPAAGLYRRRTIFRQCRISSPPHVPCAARQSPLTSAHADAVVMELLPAVNKADFKRRVRLRRTIRTGQTAWWPPWLFWSPVVPDLHEMNLKAAVGRATAPVQRRPCGLGGNHLPLQLVQPFLCVTAAPAIHPPPVRLAASLREVPEVKAATTGEAGLLLGRRLRCRIVGRRRHCQGALARTRLHRFKTNATSSFGGIRNASCRSQRVLSWQQVLDQRGGYRWQGAAAQRCTPARSAPFTCRSPSLPS